MTLVGSSKQKCERHGGRWIPQAWGEREKGSGLSRGDFWQLWTKADLQVSSLGGALGPQRASELWVSLSRKILSEEMKKFPRL